MDFKLQADKKTDLTFLIVLTLICMVTFFIAKNSNLFQSSREGLLNKSSMSIDSKKTLDAAWEKYLSYTTQHLEWSKNQKVDPKIIDRLTTTQAAMRERALKDEAYKIQILEGFGLLKKSGTEVIPIVKPSKREHLEKALRDNEGFLEKAINEKLDEKHILHRKKIVERIKDQIKLLDAEREHN